MILLNTDIWECTDICPLYLLDALIPTEGWISYNTISINDFSQLFLQFFYLEY